MGNWLPRKHEFTGEEISQAQLIDTENVEEFKGRSKKDLDRMQEDKPDLEEDDDFLE